jgi:hypothetical protein
MNLLTDKKWNLFEEFLSDYSSLFDIDKNKSKELLRSGELFTRLTDFWYEKLHQNDLNSAYKVYDDEYYFVDIFNCYVTYSREYIKRILKSKAYDDLKSIESYVDIGCGLSYSTCALKQIFPNAKAYAINIKDTKQWKFCEMMGKRYDFTLLESVDDIKHDVDLVFASEYFEHIVDPCAHFDYIVRSIKPEWFLIANAFNTHSIGHYETYDHNDEKIDQSKIGNIFNKHIRSSGYKDINYSLWNQKPKVWKKNETKPTLMSFIE